MGVVNVTPDSFSGDGLLNADTDHVANAVATARTMITDGADIIDIGAESTRPGADEIPGTSERARLIPIISAVSGIIDKPVSVDTRNARTAAAALDAGAAIINDISGLTHDPEMLDLAAERRVPVVIMHNGSRGSVQTTTLGGRFVEASYDNVVEDVRAALDGLAKRAANAGIARDAICVDPGLGFGKTVAQNLRLLRDLAALRDLGFPILVGTSRKSFIGYTLDLPVEDRLEGTAATVTVAIERGASIIRVHDVKAMARVARMTDAILDPGREV